MSIEQSGAEEDLAAEAELMAQALEFAGYRGNDPACDEARTLAEGFLSDHPIPLFLIERGRARIPKSLPVEAQELLAEFAQANAVNLRKGRHFIFWRRDGRFERFAPIEVTDKAELARLQLVQAAFLASNGGRARLEELAEEQRRRPKNKKSVVRMIGRLWRGHKKWLQKPYLSLIFKSRQIVEYDYVLPRNERGSLGLFDERTQSLLTCRRCGEFYAPRDVQDDGCCSEACSNATRQKKFRDKRKLDRRSSHPRLDAMDKRKLEARVERLPDDEWRPDEFDSDVPLELLAELCDARGEPTRARLIRELLKKGVT